MTDTEPGTVVPVGLSRVGGHWGVVVGFGAFTLLLGLVLVIWPKDTLVVLTVFIAIEFLVNGVFLIVSAFAGSVTEGGVRALLGLSGALSVLVGLLALREPLQTLTTIGVLIGAWWLVSGIVEMFTAVLNHGQRQLWRILMGAVSAVAGGFLLLNPTVSLSLLVVVMAAWLFGYGGIALIGGLQMRSLAKAETPAPAVAGT